MQPKFGLKKSPLNPTHLHHLHYCLTAIKSYSCRIASTKPPSNLSLSSNLSFRHFLCKTNTTDLFVGLRYAKPRNPVSIFRLTCHQMPLAFLDYWSMHYTCASSMISSPIIDWWLQIWWWENLSHTPFYFLRTHVAYFLTIGKFFFFFYMSHIYLKMGGNRRWAYSYYWFLCKLTTNSILLSTNNNLWY